MKITTFFILILLASIALCKLKASRKRFADDTCINDPNKSDCHTCKVGYGVSKGKCLLKFLLIFFNSYVLKRPCEKGCAVCGKNQEKCEQCKLGFSPENGKCKEVTFGGFY